MDAFVQQRLEKILKCEVCFEPFQEPKMLRCQHTYCKKCLQRMTFTYHGLGEQITCPACGVETKLQQDGVSKLPSNFLIEQLLEVNRNHIQRQPRKNCEKHPTERADLYCECGEVICDVCTVINHRFHSHKDIDEEFSSACGVIYTLVREAKPQISALKAEITSREGIEKALQQNCLDVDEQIDSFIQAKTTQLESTRARLKMDVREESASLCSSLRNQNNALLLLLCKVENVECILDNSRRSMEYRAELLRKKKQFTESLSEISSISRNIKPCKKVTLQLQEINPLTIIPNRSGQRNQAKIRVLNPSVRLSFSDVFAIINTWPIIACILMLVGYFIGSLR